jgi:fatty-acid desaturase
MNKYGAIILLLCQVVAHAALFYGFFTFSLAEWGYVFLVYFITGCLGMSITFHRLLSHCAFKSPRWFEIFGTLAASYGLTGSSLAWVNNHRAHHRYADTDKDPHAPSHIGYTKVQWGSMFTSATRLRYVKHIRRDKFHIFMHRYYFHFHAVILLCITVLFGLHAAAVFYLAPAAVLWNAGSFINTICHSRFGYTNYNVRDKSKNNFVLGVFMWGEGWHNNHHARPGAAKFGRLWFELDISWYMIRIIKKLQFKKQENTV